MKAILMLLAICTITGCSYRAAYDNIQINRRNECLKRPPVQYDECMEGATKTYDEYEKDREEYEKQRQEEIDGVKSE